MHFQWDTFLASPQPLGDVTNAVQLVSGDHHSCARIADGTVRRWGESELWQIGDGTSTTRTLATPVRF